MFLEIDTLKNSSLKVKQLFLDPFGEHLLISCGNISSSQLFYATKQLSKLKPVRKKFNKFRITKFLLIFPG